MTNPTPDQHEQYRQRAWRAYDLAADEHRDGPEWDQETYRNRCGTACCYAGLLAIDNNRPWLVDFRDGEPHIDGVHIDPANISLTDDEYILAAPDDPYRFVRERHGRRVIHVKHVAAMLIGLDPYYDHADHGGLFAGRNDLDDLERLITDQIGPRPASVGGSDN